MSIVLEPHIYKVKGDYANQPISVSGPSAVGKSTVGKNLSIKLGLPFFDLDDEVCRATEYKTTQEFIQELGHEKFKIMQNKCLTHVVESNNSRYVLAAGGEIIRPGYDEAIIKDNRNLINTHTYNICLFPSIDIDESVEVLFPRLNDGKRDIQTTGDTKDKFRQYIDVFDQYDDLSQLTILTHSATLDNLLSVIMEKVTNI